MITKIISKCNNKIKFLYRNANNLDKQTKMLLTSALIQCHFDYGSSMWYTGTTCRMKKKLQITQNKVIRFILGLPSRSHIGVTEFSSACMLPVLLLPVPLLFLLHINDLPSCVNSKVRLFADDCLLYREIKNNQDQIDMQRFRCSNGLGIYMGHEIQRKKV